MTTDLVHVPRSPRTVRNLDTWHPGVTAAWSPDRPGRLPVVTLEPFTITDEPNEYGGRGVIHRHPFYGATFGSIEQAHAFALLMGWLAEYHPRYAPAH